MKFRDAVLWNGHGDNHPSVTPIPPTVQDGWTNLTTEPFSPDFGWMGTVEDGSLVRPGDYIVTDVDGKQYPVNPNLFAETYESVQ